MSKERIKALRRSAMERSNTLGNWAGGKEGSVQLYHASPHDITKSSNTFKIVYMSFPIKSKYPDNVFVFPLPPSISDNVNAEWEDAESFLQRAASKGLNLRQIGGEALASVTRTFAGMTSDKWDRDTANLIHNDFMFRKVDLRSFAFTHKIVPQSEDESKEMKKIVDKIQQKSLPTFKSSNTRIDRPAEWEIHFLGPKGIDFLPRIEVCVMESVSINNTPNENFQPSANGYPNSVEIELSFKETVMRTADVYTNPGPAVDSNRYSERFNTARGKYNG